MAGCDVLYYDPTQVRRDPGGRPDGLADQVRWQRPGLATSPAPSREEQAQ